MFCRHPARKPKRNAEVAPLLLALAAVKRMKTEVSAPGNLSVAQLGQVLAKSKSAPADKKQDGPKPGPATTREPLPAPGAKPEEDPDLSQSEELNAGEAASGEGEETDATTESQENLGEEEAAAAETDAPTETAETTEASEAPARVSDAVLAKLNAELDPLIKELTKAGAKGALQILQKRIPKLTDQRDTERNARLAAEARLSELEGELTEAREAKPESQRTSSAVHPEVAKVATAIGQVDGFIKLLKGMPQGGEMDDGDGGKVTLTADEVAEHLDRLRDKRTELVAEKKVAERTAQTAHQETFQRIRSAASKVYPWLNQPEAPEQARMKKILEAIPGLKDLADHELIVARYFRGMKAEQDDLAKAKAPGPKKAPASNEPTKVNTAAPSGKAGPADEVAKAKQAVVNAEKAFKTSGKKEDLQRLESAKAALKRLQK